MKKKKNRRNLEFQLPILNPVPRHGREGGGRGGEGAEETQVNANINTSALFIDPKLIFKVRESPPL